MPNNAPVLLCDILQAIAVCSEAPTKPPDAAHARQRDEALTMSIRITCPECSAQYPIAAGLLDDDGKRLAALTGEMEPAMARAALSYLKFFKPAKTALRTSRALSVLQELCQAFQVHVALFQIYQGVQLLVTHSRKKDTSRCMYVHD